MFAHVINQGQVGVLARDGSRPASPLPSVQRAAGGLTRARRTRARVGFVDSDRWPMRTDARRSALRLHGPRCGAQLGQQRRELVELDGLDEVAVEAGFGAAT